MTTDDAGGVPVEMVQQVGMDMATGKCGGAVAGPRRGGGRSRRGGGRGHSGSVARGTGPPAARAPQMVLDLSAVTALDAAGAVGLAARSRDLHAAGSWLVLPLTRTGSRRGPGQRR